MVTLGGHLLGVLALGAFEEASAGEADVGEVTLEWSLLKEPILEGLTLKWMSLRSGFHLSRAFLGFFCHPEQ